MAASNTVILKSERSPNDHHEGQSGGRDQRGAPVPRLHPASHLRARTPATGGDRCDLRPQDGGLRRSSTGGDKLLRVTPIPEIARFGPGRPVVGRIRLTCRNPSRPIRAEQSLIQRLNAVQRHPPSWEADDLPRLVLPLVVVWRTFHDGLSVDEPVCYS